MDAKTKLSMFGWGAFGGIMPTLANLGSTFTTTPDTPWPSAGLYLGLAFFALVGGGIALTNTSAETRHAIFAGIAAPAIIVSVVNGASEASRRRTTELLWPVEAMIGGLASGFMQTAFAQSGANTQPTGGSKSTFESYKLLVNPTVSGGAAVSNLDIPITAEVPRGGKTETIQIGKIDRAGITAAFTIPPDASKIFVSGKMVPITGPVTVTDVNITTKPSTVGDFLWAIGAPREFNVKSIEVSVPK